MQLGICRKGHEMGFLDSIIRAISSGDDGGCDWTCDNCSAYMNDQPGFSVSSGSWRCKGCGTWNDVSEDNVVDEDYDDGYVGSYQYYVDEERRNQEEEERLRELGIDPNDD